MRQVTNLTEAAILFHDGDDLVLVPGVNKIPDDYFDRIKDDLESLEDLGQVDIGVDLDEDGEEKPKKRRRRSSKSSKKKETPSDDSKKEDDKESLDPSKDKE